MCIRLTGPTGSGVENERNIYIPSSVKETNSHTWLSCLDIIHRGKVVITYSNNHQNYHYMLHEVGTSTRYRYLVLSYIDACEYVFFYDNVSMNKLVCSPGMAMALPVYTYFM